MSAPSVNRPTDVKKRDADIARKLQFYGIISAFGAGKVPSNAQIDVALNSFLESKPLKSPPSELSDDGKKLVADVRDVVEKAKILLLSKNEGNLIQDFIWQTRQFDGKSINGPQKPVDKSVAKQHGNNALDGLRTLGKLLVTNGQFRKLLKDSLILLRDIAGDAATNVAGRVRPSEDQLSQIDRPAEENTWHDAPDVSAKGWKSKFKKSYGGKPGDDAQAVLDKGLQAANPSGSRDIRDFDLRAGLNAARDSARDTINANTSEEDREKIKSRNAEYRRRARDYFDSKMPQERKDQTIWRLKKMILECQGQPEYVTAIETLLNLAEEYGGHGRVMTQGATSAAKGARAGLSKAEDDLKVIIERFANGTSTDNLWDSIRKIYAAVAKDQELKDWFKSLDKYIRRCLLQQGYILEDSSTDAWDGIYQKGRFLLREKYKSETDGVVKEVKFLADQFDKDPQNKAFGQSVQKLFLDLGRDEDGKAAFKPHLLRDLRDVIIPGILENVAYIPIPRIEYSDPKIDLVVENLVMESDNFAPNVFEIQTEHFFRWGRKKLGNKQRQVVDVSVSGVQLDLRGVSYHIKKRGFPSVKDTGVADIQLAGEGFSFRMKMSTADPKDASHFFKVDKVDVDIKHLNIKLVKSSHKFLFALAKPILLKVLRPVLQKVLEKTIKDQVKEFDATCFKVKKEADRALEEGRADPKNAPNVYNRYATAVKQHLEAKKEKAKKAKAKAGEDRRVNVAMTMENSIFPDVLLPGAVSTKATEYKELAEKGDTWESPIFSIGSAEKSSNIPLAPQVEKKSHPLNGSNGATTNGAHGNGNTVADTAALNGANKTIATATNGADNAARYVSQ